MSVKLSILLLCDADQNLQVAIAPVAQKQGWATREICLLPQTAVETLVALQPILILVTQATTLPSVTALKTNPATRKIPVLAVLDDATLIAQASKAGCDAAIDRQTFLADPQRHLTQHAHADDSAELLRQAALPLPALAHKAIAQFNAHEFFEQHETFEEIWRAEPGPVRQLYQGLLQVGVAYLQIQRKNYDGAHKLFQRAWQYLNVLPDTAQGINVAQFRADTRAAQTALEQLGPARIAEFPPSLFNPIRFKISD